MNRARPAVRSLTLGFLVALGGCASAGSGGPEPVPVFFEEGDIPCEYEVVRDVRTEVRLDFSGPRLTVERAVARALGQEGARLGVDAVLFRRETETARVVRVPSGEAGSSIIPPSNIVGQGLRYLDPTCGKAP